MTADARRLRREIARRRTFAIISHPDAGKTTLTEKLLLYGGAIQLAGAVKARRSSRHATSDWMDIERKRGISTTTSVMSFPYRDHVLNLLDTPGHQDFSEDTYRTLAAVDSAAMLIDAAKGVEAQTEKLFRVCRRRGIPIFVFYNKLDRHGREPLDLIDEVERHLGMPITVVNWPVGSGSDFRGVFDRLTRRFHVYAGTEHGQKRGDVTVRSLDDPAVAELWGPDLHAKLAEEVSLLDEAGHGFDRDAVLAGELAPAFFGSALNNFGVDLFLDALLDLAPPPGGADTVDGGHVDADDERFSGVVFKIQANMNPAHRDRIAFCRVVSGVFRPGLAVTLQPRGARARLAEPKQFMARERKAVEEAFPGDVVGLFDPGLYRVGDTITVDAALAYPGIPFFPAELFAVARVPDASHRKAFTKGLAQLAEEGAIQVFRDPERGDRDPIVAAVGQLQFDVLRHRLEVEYGVPVTLHPAQYKAARWISGDGLDPSSFVGGVGYALALDREDRPVVLFNNAYWVEELPRRHPKVRFSEVSGATTT